MASEDRFVIEPILRDANLSIQTSIQGVPVRFLIKLFYCNRKLRKLVSLIT